MTAPRKRRAGHAAPRTDGWCDDPGHPAYNRPVRLPINASAEALWRDDALYDIIGVLGWNDDPVVPGRGSAIFLHVARPDYAPTEGCIALALDDLRRVLALGLTEIVVRAESFRLRLAAQCQPAGRKHLAARPSRGRPGPAHQSRKSR